MTQLYKGNTKSVKEIYDAFSNDALMIDYSYQRRKVWLRQDEIRLLETILMDWVIPEVFFWQASIDSDTGDTVTHIVDGQQRIVSIVEFISGDFPLLEKSLTEKEIIRRCGGKFFKELSDIDKKRIWDYRLSIIELDSRFTKSDIVKMFNRLNLTNYNLNSQEKRHGKGGSFGDAAMALAAADFWQAFHVFSPSDVRRMNDVQYCCSIYILANEGIVDQTNDQKINDYYDDYAEGFDETEILLKKIKSAINIIEKTNDKTTLSFVSKKAQMYTLFAFAFKLIDSGKEYTDEISEKFKLFVCAYNAFRNEHELHSEHSDMQKTHEEIKKYKLASSEGINKLKNRMIRFQTLYNLCVESDSNIKDCLRKLADEYEKKNREQGIKHEVLDEKYLEFE